MFTHIHCVQFSTNDCNICIKFDASDDHVDYDFVLLDLWKDLYVPCLKLFFPKLNDGAIVVADNMIFPPNTEVKEYASLIRGMASVSSVLLPVGSGIEVSRINLSNRQQIT